MKILGLNANDKGTPPTTCLDFVGFNIDTVQQVISITQEHREYTIHRLREFLNMGSIRIRDIQSITGSLGWLSFVILAGRLHRHEFDDAITHATTSTITIKPHM